MSAITGIFYRKEKKVDPQLIQKMNDKLSHRGPDGSHTWVEDNVGLGHQMLHTTPESLHEKLPFIEEDLVITADARIDNREDLAKKLDIADVETVSDSYFILKAYGRWGEDCPDKLLGDFAFAIWDRKKEILFCARDHMGVKPFYYYVDEEMFVFGSEIKALFEVEGVPRNLNEVKIADFLLYQFNDKVITFYEEILRLPNAHQIKVSSKENIIFQYWELNLDNIIKFDSEEEYFSKFKEIFFESVQCRLRSKSDIGALLSGGLDSSSIVCTAHEILKDKKKLNLKTFSAVFDEVKSCDEREYIESVIDKTNLDSNYIIADQVSPLCNFEDFFWHFDQPFYAPNLFMHWKLFEKANEKGINIILDGFDGDTTLSRQNRYLADLASNMEFSRLYKELHALNQKSDKKFLEILIEKVCGPLMPENFKKYLLKLYPYKLKYRKSDFADYLNNEFVEEYDIKKRYDNLYSNILSNANTAQKYHEFRLNSGSFQFIFELLDSIGGALSQEIRLPFFDKRLVEYCLALPNEKKYNLGWDRFILRQSLENILPNKIQWRHNKSNLSPNFNRSFFLYEKSRIIKMIESDQNILGKYVDINLLKGKIIDETNPLHYELIQIWNSLVLSLWLENSIGNFKIDHQ